MNHITRPIINQHQLANWINDIAQQAVMMTIARPHAIANHLDIRAEHMEPIISRIIDLANRYVFGKHKRFEFLKGIVIMESVHAFPHFHIVFQKPDAIGHDVFSKKLTQLATRISSRDFEFDLAHSLLSKTHQLTLAHPGYPAFAHVSATHARTGHYLTAEPARYYQLQGRSLELQRDLIEIRVDFYNHQPHQEAA